MKPVRVTIEVKDEDETWEPVGTAELTEPEARQMIAWCRTRHPEAVPWYDPDHAQSLWDLPDDRLAVVLRGPSRESVLQILHDAFGTPIVDGLLSRFGKAFVDELISLRLRDNGFDPDAYHALPEQEKDEFLARARGDAPPVVQH